MGFPTRYESSLVIMIVFKVVKANFYNFTGGSLRLNSFNYKKDASRTSYKTSI